MMARSSDANIIRHGFELLPTRLIPTVALWHLLRLHFPWDGACTSRLMHTYSTTTTPPQHRIGIRRFSTEQQHHIRTHAIRHRRMQRRTSALFYSCASALREMPPPLNCKFLKADILKQYLCRLLASCFPQRSPPACCTLCRRAACLLPPHRSSFSATETEWMKQSCITLNSLTLPPPCATLLPAFLTTSLFKWTPAQARQYLQHSGYQRDGARSCERLRPTWDLGTFPTLYTKNAA